MLLFGHQKGVSAEMGQPQSHPAVALPVFRSLMPRLLNQARSSNSNLRIDFHDVVDVHAEWRRHKSAPEGGKLVLVGLCHQC